MDYVGEIVKCLELINKESITKESMRNNNVTEINYELRQTSKFVNSIRFNRVDVMFELPEVECNGMLDLKKFMYLVRDQYSALEDKIVIYLTNGLGEKEVLELLTIYAMLGRVKCIAQKFTDMQHCIDRIGEVDFKEISKSNCAQVS